MAAALRAARWMAGEGHLIAVLGTMAELGPIAAREHERIGELAARIRVDRSDRGRCVRASDRRRRAPRGRRAGQRRVLRGPRSGARRRAAVGAARRSGAVQGVARRRARADGRGVAVKSILVAAAFALAVTLLGTPIAIKAFRVWGWGQRIREDGPHTHMEKMGTPTMGGIVIVIGLFVGVPRVPVHLPAPDARGSRLAVRGRRVRDRRLPRRFPEGPQGSLARSFEVPEVLRDGGRVGPVRGRRRALLAGDGHIDRAVVHPHHGHQPRRACSTCGRS